MFEKFITNILRCQRIPKENYEEILKKKFISIFSLLKTKTISSIDDNIFGELASPDARTV